jgi:hypothetical protein
LGDYRDDRQALRQRVEELEHTLAETERRAADRDALSDRVEELEREKTKLEEELTGRPRPTLPVGLLVTAAVSVLVALAGGIAFMRSAPVPAPLPAHAPVPTPPTTPPAAKPLPPPPSWEASETCRCPGNAGVPRVVLAFEEGGTLSFGNDVTRFVSWKLQVSDAGGDPRHVALAVDVETVPAPRVQGGQLELLMACLPQSLVLAQGQRVSAWSLESGQQLWSHALGTPVGSARSGALAVRCSELKTDAKKRIVLPQGSGRVLLDPNTGDEAK